ncbi:hypothetical protein M3Y97_00291000 [Aphelenchoides bicaudatus]|nr:hypothetical protein M3Y97_00291000 [Aphelenchoides bicaudatus]
MADRMKTFDKCVDQLLDAVTTDMIHVDNLSGDISKVSSNKVTRDKKKKLGEIREKVLDQFREEVKKSVETKLKPSLNLQECFDDFENKHQQAKKAWRINGDPQHDTYAQRRPIYLDYLKQLDSLTEELEKQRDDLTANLR